MAELGLFKAILGLKKAELELFGGNIQKSEKFSERLTKALNKSKIKRLQMLKSLKNL